MENIREEIRKGFSPREEKVRGDNYLFVVIETERLLDFISFAKEKLQFEHLSSISAVDYLEEGKFSLSYNLFSYSRKVLLTAKIYIERQKAEFHSVSHIYAAACFFERDIFEMFGIRFEGNPCQKKFILDEWAGPPPLRKDFDTRKYAQEHFTWRLYEPQWAKELGLKPEDLEGEDIELL